VPTSEILWKIRSRLYRHRFVNRNTVLNKSVQDENSAYNRTIKFVVRRSVGRSTSEVGRSVDGRSSTPDHKICGPPVGRSVDLFRISVSRSVGPSTSKSLHRSRCWHQERDMANIFVLSLLRKRRSKNTHSRRPRFHKTPDLYRRAVVSRQLSKRCNPLHNSLRGTLFYLNMMFLIRCEGTQQICTDTNHRTKLNLQIGTNWNKCCQRFSIHLRKMHMFRPVCAPRCEHEKRVEKASSRRGPSNTWREPTRRSSCDNYF
jgi:hypothetical protein